MCVNDEPIRVILTSGGQIRSGWPQAQQSIVEYLYVFSHPNTLASMSPWYSYRVQLKNNEIRYADIAWCLRLNLANIRAN